MGGTTVLFKNIFKKAVDLSIKNGLCFIRLFIAFFTPLVFMYIYFWDNQIFVQKIIDRFTLPGFVLIDDTINYIVLVYFLLYLVAIVQSIHAVVRGGNPGAIASYRKALGVFGAYLWVKILSLFKALCWALLLIVPGIVKGVFYNFSGLALLIDGKHGNEALIRSQKIIKSNASQYLANYLFITVIVGVACVLITLNLEGFVNYFRLKGNTFLVWAITCGEIGLIALALSFFLTFYYFLYMALSEGVEG